MKVKLYIALLFSFVSLMLYGQTYTVSGYVTDKETGETIIGVTIKLKDKNVGVVTGLNGFFQFPGIPIGSHILQFSHVSYTSKEITIQIIDKSLLLDETQLEPDVVKLNEVSVVEVSCCSFIINCSGESALCVTRTSLMAPLNHETLFNLTPREVWPELTSEYVTSPLNSSMPST